MKTRVLVVDDDQSMCELLETGLSKAGHEVTWKTTGDAAKEYLQQHDIDVVISDLQLAATSGLALCEWVVSNRPNTPVIVITGFGSMESAISAIRVGAYDFINKPVEMEALNFAVNRAARHRYLEGEVKRLREAAGKEASRYDLVGDSRVMCKVYDLIERIGMSDPTVLITGESGTGKELVARALHAHSTRRDKPIVAINCAAMPSTLLESELFGHVKGAFTDAKQSREGLFLQANDGTLFLDEVGEMPLEMQPKLLRALQENVVRPIGSDRDVPFNTRIIAATNRDLEAEVEEGRFREDLFYRINVVQIPVPPLRSRGHDILLLAQHFLEQTAQRVGKDVKGLSSTVAQKLRDYDWPGNVRELRNCIERAVTLTQFDQVVVEDLPEKIRDYQCGKIVIVGDDPAELITIEELERRYIERVLKAAGDNKTQAAKVLGLDRRTLYRKLERYEKSTPDRD